VSIYLLFSMYVICMNRERERGVGREIETQVVCLLGLLLCD